MAKRKSSFLPILFGSGNKGSAEAVKHVLSGTPIWDGIGTLYGDYEGSGWDFESAVTKALERNIWVARCVDVIATAQSRIPIVMRQGSPVDGKEVQDDVLKLLNQRPNDYEDAVQFRYKWSSQSLISKRGTFIEPVFTNGGRVAELHLIPPDVIQPIPDEKTFIRGFRVEGKYRWGMDEIPRNKLIWIRSKPHPRNAYEQMTPLVALALSIETDLMARLYNRNYLGNGGKNGLLVMVQGLMGMTDAEEMRQRFQGGPGQSGRPTVIEGTGVTVQDLGATPHDAQWLEAMAGAKKEILEAFGVPESLLGDASGRTFDNADAEAENFWSNTEVGHCDGFARGLDQLTGAIDDDRFICFNYDSVDVLQRQKRRKEEKALEEFNAGTITLDEYREATGKDPFDTPESRSLYLTVTGKAALAKDPKDQKQAGETTPIGQPSMDDQKAMQDQQMGAAAGAQAGQANNQLAQRRFDSDLASRTFGAGFGSGGSRPGFGSGSGKEFQPSRFGSGQGGYNSSRANSFGSKSLEPLDDAMMRVLEKAIADTERERAVVEAEVVEPVSGVNPHAGDLDIVEAELGGIIDRWSDEQGEVLPERVMHTKVRKFTRHWESEDGSGIGTKALNPQYIVDVDRWAAGLAASLRKGLDRAADREARRGARDMDTSGFAALMHTKNIGPGDPAGKTHLDRVFGGRQAMDDLVKTVVDPLEQLVKDAAARQSQRVVTKILEMDANGASAKEIQGQIRKMTGQRGPWRKQLARFLTTSVVEGTRTATYGLAGRLLKKTWNTVGDERVRPTHIDADQQTKTVGVNFRVGQSWMMYPGDPKGPLKETINCRCWIEYEVADRYGSLFDDTMATSGAGVRP